MIPSWLKTLARNFWQRGGMGQLLAVKDSRPYWIYLTLLYPSHVKAKRAESRFYKHLLANSGNGLAFDIGANCGDKAVIFSRFVPKVVCVEPSPKAAVALRQRFQSNPRIVVVEAGVGDSVGRQEFYTFEEASPFNTFSTKWRSSQLSEKPTLKTKSRHVQITTLDELIKEHGTPDYIKIDTEGYEVSAIRGLSVSVPLISFECNLPCFAGETLECLEILAKRNVRFNYCLHEPPTGFESARWLCHAEIARVLESKTAYVEVFCISAA